MHGYQYHTSIKYLEKENLKLSMYLFYSFVVLKLFTGTKFCKNGRKSQNLILTQINNFTVNGPGT